MSRPSFQNQLAARWNSGNSLVCVGLDPDPERFPEHFDTDVAAIADFCKAIVDATAQYACTFKPQIAHFAARGAESALEDVIDHIHRNHSGVPVILDAKRGDIGSTAEHYVAEAFTRYDADAVTVNPFLGRDSVQPFLDVADRGVIILCRTSNPGGAELQAQDIDGQPMYLNLAARIASEWNEHGNCALVVGATWPEELARVRKAVGDMPLLVPGVGAQGGSAQDVVVNAQTQTGDGLMINSSRGILYASRGADFASAAATAARDLRDEINRHRHA